MQLTVRLFGLEFLHVELCDPEDEPPDRGDLGTTIIEAGRTDVNMGFTNGREDE